MPCETERRLSIPADLSRLGEARRFAAEAATKFGFDSAVREQIRLAVNEAVANAVEHGSSVSDDEVEVQVAAIGDSLVFHVRDRGAFVPREARVETLPERGRGLAFMELLMDEVEVRPGEAGTVIRMSRRRRPEG